MKDFKQDQEEGYLAQEQELQQDTHDEDTHEQDTHDEATHEQDTHDKETRPATGGSYRRDFLLGLQFAPASSGKFEADAPFPDIVLAKVSTHFLSHFCRKSSLCCIVKQVVQL